VFAPFDNDTLASLESAHGEIRVVRGEKPPAKRWRPDDMPETPWEAVFRKPTVGECDNFEGAAHQDKARAAALRNLAKATVVGVSRAGKQVLHVEPGDARSKQAVRDAWDALRNDYSGAHMAAQKHLMSLAGMSDEEEGKE